MNTEFGDRIGSKLKNWSNAIRSNIFNNKRNDLINHNLISQSSTQNTFLENSTSSGGSGRLNSDYTELMGGSIPCPSCNGSGLIPKELESTLVALIPVNDERLKPNKTWMYIIIWVSICIVVGGTLLFLLMPKTVTLDSNNMPIQFVNVYRNLDKNEIDFFFMNKVNITSGNYLPVYVVNVTALIISKFQPWSSDLVGSGTNDTLTQFKPLPLLHNTQELSFNNTVELKGVASEYCQADFWHLTSLYVNLRFDLAVTLRYYYGHQEQVTLSMQQQVCCIPTGNCTTS